MAMFRALLLLHVWIVAALWSLASAQRRPDFAGNFEEKALIKKLMTNYQRVGLAGRPVKTASDQITVELGFALIQILEVDVKYQVLTVNAWLRIRWRDQLLLWDPQQYNKILSLRLPPKSIWTPDIVLYNSAEERTRRKYEDTLVVASSKGEVLWVPTVILKSSCIIDTRYFPFDQQVCRLKFGSWTYDGFKVNITFWISDSRGKQMNVDLNDYIANREWAIIGTKAVFNEFKYPCCEEPYPDITYYLQLERQPGLYSYTLVFPCILLSILLLLTFWIPPESPAKIILGIIIFLAFFFLLLVLVGAIPSASSTVPLMGSYFCLNMVFVTLSTLLSVLVMNIYCRGENSGGVPGVLKSLFRLIGRILLVREAKLLGSADSSQGLSMSKQKSSEEGTDAETAQVADQKPVTSMTASDTLEGHVGEIQRAMKSLTCRIDEKEASKSTARQWRAVALVLDRFFFICYLIIVIVSAVAILSQRPEKESFPF